MSATWNKQSLYDKNVFLSQNILNKSTEFFQSIAKIQISQ